MILLILVFDIIKKGEIAGTKGVSQNHLLSFDNNKVLKIINWILLNNLFKCIGSKIKVLFIKILIDQVQEQRNFIWSLEASGRKRLKKCIWRNGSEEELLNTRHQKQGLLEQGCFTSHLLSFDNNKVLKIINWIC